MLYMVYVHYVVYTLYSIYGYLSDNICVLSLVMRCFIHAYYMYSNVVLVVLRM